MESHTSEIQQSPNFQKNELKKKKNTNQIYILRKCNELFLVIIKNY